MEQKSTTKMYVEFEFLDDMPLDANVKDLYPHDGIFLIRRIDGMMSVVEVERGAGNEICKNYLDTIVGSRPTIDSDDVMHVSEFNKKTEEYFKWCDEQYQQRKKELQAEFNLRKEKLEHDYEMKNLQLEQEMPKRFEQGEWVSGKTLSDIIKTLVGKEDKQ